MATVSIGIAQELMVDILIINTRVMRTRSGYATYIYKKNHGIITDMLTSKWCILIDKAKRTIQYKTHNNVRSALKSLTQRYRTYFLAQRLC